MAGERWDRDRLMYERSRQEDDRYMMRGGRGRDHSDDRFDRPRYHDDDLGRSRGGYYDDEPRMEPRRERPDYDRRVVMEKERERDYYRDSSPRRRPGYPRRQSSLDTFDRRPLRHLLEPRDEYPPPARREDVYRGDYRAPPYTPIPLPKTRALPPPRRYYDDADDDDAHLAYGPDDVRPPPLPERVRERELVRSHERRDRSRESRTTRTRTHRSSSPSSSASSRSSSSAGGTTVRSEYPKRGKTKIPARLVSKRALIDLGYPFFEEGNTIIVQKALGQDNIDELLKLSEDYNKGGLLSVRQPRWKMLTGPPYAAAEHEVAAARSSAGNLAEERREGDMFLPLPPPPPRLAPPPTAVPTMPPPPPSVHHPPPPPTVGFAPATPVYAQPLPPAAPPVAAPTAPPPTVVPPPPAVPVPPPAPTIVEAPPPAPPAVELVDRTRTVIRDVSPARTATTSTTSSWDSHHAHHHHHHRHHHDELVVGPVVHRSRSRSRSGREIRAEIRALERELAHRPKGELGEREIVRTERLPDGELIIYQEKVERQVAGPKPPRIEKDKKGRLSISVPKYR